MSSVDVWLWTGFIAIVVALLAVDLAVFNRQPHEIATKEALGWTAFWIALGVLFTVPVYFIYEHDWLGGIGQDLSGWDAVVEYITAYLVEKSLSLDNIFVFKLIFDYFQLPAKYQHRVLFWGIVGAMVTRGAFIAAGLALIRHVDWIVYVFGGFLILTAIRMLLAKEHGVDPAQNPLLRLARRVFPVTEGYREQHFFVKQDGKRCATPLFMALIFVESTDVMFAVDSIPAVLAVTTDAFIVFTSNIFAILGLRALYFAVAVVIDRFRYLKQSLFFILGFVGVKMILSHHVEIPAWVSLAIILVAMLAGIVASKVWARRHPKASEARSAD